VNRQLAWTVVVLVGLLLATAVALFAIIRFDGFEAWPAAYQFESVGWTSCPPDTDPIYTCFTFWDDPAQLDAWDDLGATAAELQERLDDVPESEAQHADTRRMAIDLRYRLLVIDRQVSAACMPDYD